MSSFFFPPKDTDMHQWGANMSASDTAVVCSLQGCKSVPVSASVPFVLRVILSRSQWLLDVFGVVMDSPPVRPRTSSSSWRVCNHNRVCGLLCFQCKLNNDWNLKDDFSFCVYTKAWKRRSAWADALLIKPLLPLHGTWKLILVLKIEGKESIPHVFLMFSPLSLHCFRNNSENFPCNITLSLCNYSFALIRGRHRTW